MAARKKATRKKQAKKPRKITASKGSAKNRRKRAVVHKSKMSRGRPPTHHLTRHHKCKFCDIIHGKRASKIWFENDHIAVVDGRPHHKGHLVVMPRTHEEHIMLLHPKTLNMLFDDLVLICRALHRAIKFDRLNFEYLDNWDPHIHINVYPRFQTDPDWGNPPRIPEKGVKFKSRKMSAKEEQAFTRELMKIKDKL